jgi:hypothetical protein
LTDLYHTFGPDISDSSTAMFHPLIQLKDDDSAEVRITVLNCLISCGVRDDEISAGVIQMLGDTNQLVR